ncbi:MAG: phosphodiesterase/alkaline phosphatase [Segetibacter sp.]|nr:phosphodiesterase/alkaline phosphatase [Segetibacter sp.]
MNQFYSPKSNLNYLAFLPLYLVISILPYSNAATSQGVEPSLKPFYHGVASGDPLSNSIVLWTRVTPEGSGAIVVQWKIAERDDLSQIVQSGDTIANAGSDYTVKVDVKGLVPGKEYYYQFSALNYKSPLGKTKTAPTGTVDNVRFAVVSCSNFGAGYFSALGKIAERKNLDAVIHLGDFIYEGTIRTFDKNNRVLGESDPLYPLTGKTKDWWLSYYRKRYAATNSDSNMRKARQVLPFINIWDDHEIGDNSYRDGAYGHNPSIDGNWKDRKEAAQQVFFEWIPIRNKAGFKIYRSLKYGNLLELMMLDTRVEGRDKQVTDINDKVLLDPNRTLLGKEQKLWLLDKLASSTSQWKIIGNQVIFSEFNVKWAADFGPVAKEVAVLQRNLLDYWEGYPLERDEVIKTITKNKIDNVVILSGSMHCALAMDVALRPSKFSRKGEVANYDLKTGIGSVAVEFATPSISSDNFDEKIGAQNTSFLTSIINKKLPFPFNFNPNPQLKFVDLQNNGYYVLSVSKTKVLANYYFINNRLNANSKEKFVEGWYTLTKQNHLQKSNGE